MLEGYAEALGSGRYKVCTSTFRASHYGPKGEKEHLPMEEADLDLQALFRALHDLGCRGRILCESPAMEDDALLIKKFWDELG